MTEECKFMAMAREVARKPELLSGWQSLPSCGCAKCVANTAAYEAEHARRAAAEADANASYAVYVASRQWPVALEYLAKLCGWVDAERAIRETFIGLYKGPPGRVHCGDYVIIPTRQIIKDTAEERHINAVHLVTGWPKYLIASATDAAMKCLTEEQKSEVEHVIANASHAFIFAQDEIAHDLRRFGLDAFAFRTFDREQED